MERSIVERVVKHVPKKYQQDNKNNGVHSQTNRNLPFDLIIR